MNRFRRKLAYSGHAPLSTCSPVDECKEARTAAAAAGRRRSGRQNANDRNSGCSRSKAVHPQQRSAVRHFNPLCHRVRVIRNDDDTSYTAVRYVARRYSDHEVSYLVSGGRSCDGSQSPFAVRIVVLGRRQLDSLQNCALVRARYR